ncbi:unnamed protein product, partial [Polarella glacialis]
MATGSASPAWPSTVRVSAIAGAALSVTAVGTAFWAWRQRKRPGESASAPKAGISQAEVARHSSPESVWIIIDSQVYDVTSWLKDHPGGEVLLLAFAGRDATAAHMTVGHSSELVKTELRRMHLGPLLKGVVANRDKIE